MWNGKKKGVTFSFDDGSLQDQGVIEILNKYGLKGTFNLNSEILGSSCTFLQNGKTIFRHYVKSEKVKELYSGHEVAGHTLNHKNLTTLNEKEVIRQVEQDRINLTKLVGYDVVGMAYPCGGQNNNDQVAKILKNNTGIKYARTINSNDSFSLQDNLYRFNPTTHSGNIEHLYELWEKFISLNTEEFQLFYIWGHSYEFDENKILYTDKGYTDWSDLDYFCKNISKRKEIFYGTNSMVFLNKNN